MNTEILLKIESFAEQARADIIHNLKRRRVVGQRMLIKDIRIEITPVGENFEIDFIFERQSAFTVRHKSGVEDILDPMFKTRKPFSREKREISFTKKADVFNALKNKYFPNMVAEVAKIDADLARRLVIRKFSFDDTNAFD